jgi:hypothetical protein
VGLRSAVATPIVGEGRLWGAIAIGTRHGRFPDDTEQRMAGFTELIGTAIANADSRAQLTASRARIVAAADDARRRIERDLHDGTSRVGAREAEAGVVAALAAPVDTPARMRTASLLTESDATRAVLRSGRKISSVARSSLSTMASFTRSWIGDSTVHMNRGSHVDAVRAEGERRGETASVREPAGGDHGGGQLRRGRGDGHKAGHVPDQTYRVGPCGRLGLVAAGR